MAFLVKGPAYGQFQKQAFATNGVLTQFDLSYSVPSASAILVVVGGVVQEPDVAYNVVSNGSKIQFTEAPTTEAYCVYLGKQLLMPVQAGYEVTLNQFTGNGSTSVFTLTHNPVINSGLVVFVNGIQQTIGAGKNFTLSGMQIVFSSAPTAGAEIDVYILAREKVGIETVSDGVLSRAKFAEPIKNSIGSWSVVSTNTAIVDGTWYMVNTLSGSITMTLPSNPLLGDTVKIIDYAGTFATNNCNIARNGKKINGLNSDMTLNGNGQNIELIFTGNDFGWRTF